jgi:hypothetical protein
MKYRIYIDEVGNADLGSSSNENHRFLSLTGIIIELDHVAKSVHPDMEALKLKYFGSHPDEPVILHRAEMVNAKPPFEVLKNPMIKAAFDAELLTLLKQWDYRVVTVCIDKKRHRETYKVWRFDPYHYCLAVLMERFVFFLDGVDARGDAMAESRGGKEDTRLKASFENLITGGSEYLPGDRFLARLTSKQLKVKPKHNNIAGLQLADLIAHPSRNEILNQQELLGRPIAPFAERVIDLLQGKYYQKSGRVFGKKLIWAHEKGPFRTLDGTRPSTSG